jgi:hypothetical protein
VREGFGFGAGRGMVAAWDPDGGPLKARGRVPNSPGARQAFGAPQNGPGRAATLESLIGSGRVQKTWMSVRARQGPKLVVCAKTNDLEDAEVRPNADHENLCHIRRSIRANRSLYFVRFCGSLVGETAGVPGASLITRYPIRCLAGPTGA